MLAPLSKTKLLSGQAIFGLIVATAIFTILAGAVFSLVILAYESISLSRARITARHLAQEKIEFIRNLPFDDVGTSGGIPSGPLPQTESILRNGLPYVVRIGIVYVDDPFDQLAPDDLLPSDYKRVRVDVSWGGLGASESLPITFISDIAPKGIETAAGGGTLSILVFDANAQPVPQASVHIVANEPVPPIDLTLETAVNGRIILPAAPPCNSCYEISVSKDGFSSERTYSTTEVANPNKPHTTILESGLTEISFAIDRLSTLHVASYGAREAGFPTAPNQTFTLRGEKFLGTDVADLPVYKFEEEFTTGGGGIISIEELEWDNYVFSISESSGVDISGTNPLTPIILLPNQVQNFSFALFPHSDNSLLTIFKSDIETPVASVSAQITLDTYTASGSSGLETDPDWGHLFFADLSAGTYAIEATASGFLDYTGNVVVAGQTFEEIILAAEE